MTQRKTTNIIDTSLKELSIQVSLSGLSFCIRDTAKERITALEHRYFEQPANAESLVEELRRLLEEDALASTDFKEVKVIHDNELSTFVPRALFNESNLSDYLKYSVKILETDYISFDEIKSHDMFNVYVPFTNVNNFIFDRFGSFEYKHASTILVETLLNRFKGGDNHKVFVQVGRTHFDVVVLSDKKLLLHNSFSYQTREDFIYYLLYIFEQLDLNREETELHLLGDIQEGDGLYNIAYTYIRKVSLGDSHNPTLMADHLQHMDKQTNLVLLNSF
ncbi:DUF3822 family protein [Robertkochia flava]|uniref:DUF3822 family protein n=1 Tax=Robertkochia flava TaxID=3447986 RepID=UPI001CCB8752|nr:DUF3822 family protein [Robertkochia marina]